MKLDDSVSFRVHHLYSFRNVQIDKFWLVHANTDFDCQLFKKIKQWIQKITEHLFRALNNLCAFSNEICTKHEFWSYLWYSVTLKFVEICFNNSTLMHSWKNHSIEGPQTYLLHLKLHSEHILTWSRNAWNTSEGNKMNSSILRRINPENIQKSKKTSQKTTAYWTALNRIERSILKTKSFSLMQAINIT